ncbi:MAG: zinc ribbon domain-containing protein, partial [Candidatus Dormibacteria bacterium]
GKGLAVPFAQPKSLGEQAELDRITDLVTAGKLISCRITRTKVRGRWAYRAQLVMDGAAPVRHPVGSEQVSLDLGPSTAHVVSETNAFHASLAPGIVPANQALRLAQRKLDRQHRQGSPSCFDAQHRHQADSCDWKERSHSAQRTQVKVAEFHRVLAARRNTEHGQLANQLIRLGPNLRAEKLNYVAWQKSFPRSVRDRAPGSFVAKLRHKAESAGGRLYEYDPRTTALSQTCVCERKAKKPLSQRLHSCECGVVADRDLFSAFLGLYVEPREDIDTLDAGLANTAFSTRHDLGGAPASRNAAGAAKQRVHRCRPSGHRSVVRIAKRLQGRSDRAARPKSVQPLPTARAAQAMGSSRDSRGETGIPRIYPWGGVKSEYGLTDI